MKFSDPFEDPLIDPKFLSHPDDVTDLVEGYKKMMAISNKSPVSKYTSSHVQRPIDLNDNQDIEQAQEKKQILSIIQLELARWVVMKWLW